MDTLEELFFSKSRKMVDNNLKRVIKETTTSTELFENCIYHMKLDTVIDMPSLEHSKRLRPYLCMLLGEENNYNDDIVCKLATSVELIHNATLIIDDVQDNDAFRCGREALWKMVGIPKAINSAFFLASIGQSLYHKTQVSHDLYDYSYYFHKQFGLLISGQQKDLGQIGKGLNAYFDMVDGKTGSLLQLCCVLGAYPYGAETYKIRALEEFALSFARIHQLNDDIDDIKKKENKLDGILGYVEKSYLYEIREKIISDLKFQLDRLFEVKIIKTNKFISIVEDLVNRH